MAEILIIADDLSGAADCGIACVAAGLASVVVLGETSAGALAADALAVDADTRRLAPPRAAAESARLMRAFAGEPGALLFKKFDSTLRGHFAGEIAAMLQVRRATAGDDAVALVAPAFPATGRTTRGGRQYVDGVAVEQTDVWRREGIPGQAHLPTMLTAAGLRVGQLDLAAVRRDSLSAALVAAGRGHDAVVCDAETEADLRAIAIASLALGRGTLWAGSAGLARHLPAAAGLMRPSAAALDPPPAEGPILFVVGSLSAVSRAQVERLAAAPGVMLLTVAPHVLRGGQVNPAWHAEERRLNAALASGRDVVVMLGTEDAVDMGEGLRLCTALARLVAPHARRIGGLVSTGGETARAVLLAFGAVGLRLAGEIEPGVPLSLTEGGRDRLPVITKAGAFGRPDTLLRCRETLRHPAPRA